MPKVLGGNPFDPDDEQTDIGKRRRGKPDDAAVSGTAEAAPPEPADEPPVDAAPDTVPPDEAFGEVFYGEEAAPTPGDYGPGLDKRTQIPYTRPITEEVREIER